MPTSLSRVLFVLLVTIGLAACKGIPEQLIIAEGSGSSPTSPNTYQADVAGEQFYIEMVSISGESQRHGPYALGVEYGTASTTPGEKSGSEYPLYLPIMPTE